MLNEGLETLVAQCFAYTNITELTIPSTVKSIAESALPYYKIEKLTILSAYISQLNTSFFNENSTVYCYKNCGLYKYCQKNSINCESLGLYIPEDTSLKYSINEDETITITGCNSKFVTEITIPEKIDGFTVTGIKNLSYPYLEKVIMPDTITTIAECAFYGCENLQTLRLSANISALPTLITGQIYEDHTGEFVRNTYMGVFQNCYNLNKVIIPTSMTKIEYATFIGCGLEKIVIPASIEYIEDDFKAMDISSVGIHKYNEHDLTIYTYPDATAAIRFANYREIPYKIIGDVSGNNEIDSSDALTLLNTVVGNSEKTEDMEVCDFDYDGEITSADVLQVLNYIVGNIDSLY
ncbi:MAG: leucine-rich repeat protein [Oscillospiraceae bacterium]